MVPNVDDRVEGPGATTSKVAVYFDPATHHQLGGRLFERGSNPYAGDDILAPYAAMKDALVERGFRVDTADRLPERSDGRRNLLISFGVPDRMATLTVRRYRALARRPDVVMSAFFAMECPIVEPTLFVALPEFGRLFRRVLSWSDTQALLPFTHEPVALEHFCWPQSFDAVHDEIWARRDRGFLVMMNANKLPRLYVDELYTARLEAVEYFHRHDEIDLYGRNWNRPPVRVGKTWTPATLRRVESWLRAASQRLSPDPLYVAAAAAWRGAAPSKSETISRYRFALCFENSMLKGWITEKIFDCFFAGTIPVYWGAPDILDWVPPECFIDMREFGDFDELRRFLHGLSPEDEARYRDAARTYLSSERFDPWRIRTWVNRITRIVDEDSMLAEQA